MKNLESIVQKIVLGYQPDKIFVFGSYATDTVVADSDLDLLIVKNTQIPFYKRSREVRKFLYGTKTPMDLLIYTDQELSNAEQDKYSVVYQALQHGKLIYAK